MMLPSFFIVGSSRAGTTCLKEALNSHPDVFIPDRNDLRYFVKEDIAINHGGPKDSEIWRSVTKDLGEYGRAFVGGSAHAAVGEVCPAYLDSEVPTRIKNVVDDARIIVILRNPVDRAFSSFRLERASRHEHLEDFQDALEAESTRCAAHWSYVWRYKQRGLYHFHLRPFFATFGRQNVLVHLYEDWQSGDKVVRKTLEFLKISTLSKNWIQPTGINSVRDSDFIDGGMKPPRLAPATRKHLLDTYRSDIARLEELIDRDLSAWRDDRNI